MQGNISIPSYSTSTFLVPTNSANYVRDDTLQTELLHEGSLAEFGAAETFSMLSRETEGALDSSLRHSTCIKKNENGASCGWVEVSDNIIQFHFLLSFRVIPRSTMMECASDSRQSQWCRKVVVKIFMVEALMFDIEEQIVQSGGIFSTKTAAFATKNFIWSTNISQSHHEA